MMPLKIKLPILAASFFILAAFGASRASAEVRVFTLSMPPVITDPNAGFNINYTMGGSNVGVGAAFAQVNFYLSTTSNGSSGVALLYSVGVGLSGSGSGPYFPPSGTRTAFIHPINLNDSGRALLQSIASTCQPTKLFLLADVNGGTFSAPASSTMGSTKLPDLSFTGGTISSTVIAPGGTTNISFDVATRCPTSSASRVGIFLTDSSLNPLAFIGAVSIGAGAGTWSLPPTPITFSPSIPLGSYQILLVADVDGIVAESNETNNGGSFPLTVVQAFAATNRRSDAQLEPDLALRGDVGPELEDLEANPPADYVTKF